MKFTWSNACFNPESTCAQKAVQAQQAQCADTQTWFWLLAIGLGAAALMGGK